MAIPLPVFERVASEIIDEWYPDVQSYHFNGYEIVLDVKYNRRNSTYNAFVGFDENGNFCMIGNPYGAAAPGRIGNAIERELKNI